MTAMTQTDPDTSPAPTPATDTAVLFNAQCPVCAFEIGHYAAYAGNNALPIRFDDLNCAAGEWGIDTDTAARRLYVLHAGELVSGMPAFRVLWAQMPRYLWLARVTGWPVVRPVTVFTYDRILAPVIYRWHKRRQARLARHS